MTEEKKMFKCKYCGLDFYTEKDLGEHVKDECIGKIIRQRTSIIGKLEKFVEGLSNGGKEVFDIKEGIKILQKMEGVRKKGNVPVIKISSVKQAKDLKKVIDFRGEIIYAGDNDRSFLNFIISLNPRLVIGKFSETDEKIFDMNKIGHIQNKDIKVEIKDTCGEIKPEQLSKTFSNGEIKNIRKGSELKLVLDLSLVDETEGKKRILQSGKMAVPLIEKKLEELERGAEKPKKSLEERLEDLESKMDSAEKTGKEQKKEVPEEEIGLKKEESREIKKEKNLAEELNLINLKGEYLKVKEKKGEEEKKPGLFSSLKKKDVKPKKAKATLKEAALENLSKSKEIEDFDKAAIIVAHVLKQFLEIKIECNKELTYLELIEKLKSVHLPLDYVDRIIKFYKDMHIQEYKDEVRVNFQETYELAERVINDLA